MAIPAVVPSIKNCTVCKLVPGLTAAFATNVAVPLNVEPASGLTHETLGAARTMTCSGSSRAVDPNRARTMQSMAAATAPGEATMVSTAELPAGTVAGSNESVTLPGAPVADNSTARASPL
jgi:hypothetical protein